MFGFALWILPFVLATITSGAVLRKPGWLNDKDFDEIEKNEVFSEADWLKDIDEALKESDARETQLGDVDENLIHGPQDYKEPDWLNIRHDGISYKDDNESPFDHQQLEDYTKRIMGAANSMETPHYEPESLNIQSMYHQPTFNVVALKERTADLRVDQDKLQEERQQAFRFHPFIPVRVAV